MPTYTVGAGESIPSIANENGFFWETIWNHPSNASLKAKRKDPNVLFEGDEVFVPELELREETRPTDQDHKFVLKGEPVKFKLRLCRLDEPRANEPYILEIDGQLFQGTTDGDGKLEQLIPGNADGGRLILRGGEEIHAVKIGHLDPIDEPNGIQQRLNNLGFDCPIDGEIGEETHAALAEFQAKYDLEVSGEPDDQTKTKLKELHP